MTELVILNVVNVIIAMTFLIIVAAIIGGGKMRKSKNYRKFLTDMYVAAKIRFLAGEDSLDLCAENDNYKAWCKKQKAEERDYDLDNTVEEELKERVGKKKPKKKEK